MTWMQNKDADKNITVLQEIGFLFRDGELFL